MYVSTPSDDEEDLLIDYDTDQNNNDGRDLKYLNMQKSENSDEKEDLDG